MKNPATYILQDSGKTEYYTPMSIVEAARATMGGIDLDPASSAKANEIVQAANYYAKDGLHQIWYGRVWMNHPFSRKDNARWIDTLIAWHESGSIEQACCITFASTSEKWFQPLLDYPHCCLAPRTNYYLPDGSVMRGVPKGSIVTYLGPNLGAFVANFHNKLGKVALPAGMFPIGQEQ